MGVKRKTASYFVRTIADASPWFLAGGGLNVADWEHLKLDLQRGLQKRARALAYGDVLPMETGEGHTADGEGEWTRTVEGG